MCVRSATKGSNETRTFKCIGEGTSPITRLISRLVAPKAILVTVAVFSPGWRLSSNTKIFALFDEFNLNSRLDQLQPPLRHSMQALAYRRCSYRNQVKEFASEQLKLAMAERAYAEKGRQEAKREMEMAEIEFASAKRIKQQARTELERAQMLKDQSTKKLKSTIMQITCQACKNKFLTSMAMVPADKPRWL
ncbi:hypothetical protein F3Y22_tig00010263pilonHSYRG00101 [Hibiscus syriacus]|uniref:Uncharacterized protein n=1 Tax=Hibiscus syriacus TaxID=106335 RepID=A0A6A3C718_HIBSY|nr:hypothetical protein F3Y22_tig00010263pilonHSYRG00101 [Hibiscus syriacus]